MFLSFIAFQIKAIEPISVVVLNVLYSTWEGFLLSDCYLIRFELYSRQFKGAYWNAPFLLDI